MEPSKTSLVLKYSLVFFGFLFWTGCTRPSNNHAKISLQLPVSKQSTKLGDVSAQSTLWQLIINVTGPGLQGPFVFEWSADHPNDRCLNNVCSFEVLSGDSRLIQVLAVYEDATGYGIYYNDITKTLIAGSNTVDLTLNPITTQSTITEVQLSGRYLTTATTGPTGKLEVRYNPPGKPSMLLMGSEMFNGWFQVFGIKGIQFDYVFNGKSIMNGPIDPASFDSKLGNSLLKMVWPSYYRQDGGSSSVLKLENALNEYVGFFGPGLTGSEKVCYGSSAGSISNSYKDINKTTLNYSVNSASSTDVYVAGGGISGESNCTADYTSGTTLGYNPVTSKEPIHFEGPFIRDSNGNLLNVNNGTATWDYLPLATAGLESMKLFILNSQNMEQFSMPMAHSMMNCSEINRRALANDPDVKIVGTVPKATKQLAIPANLDSLFPSPAAVLCPILPGGAFMNSVARTWDNGDHGGNGPYLRFEIMTNGGGGNGNYKLNTNQCYEVHPTLYDNGNRFTNTTSAPYVINGVKNLNGSIGVFYSSSICSSALTADPSIAVGSSDTNVWFKPTTAGLNQQFNGVTVSNSSGSTVNFEPSYNQFDVGNPKIILNVNPKLVQNECVGVTVSLQDFSGQPVQVNTTLTASLNQNASWGLWDNSACSSGTSAISFEPEQGSSQTAYIKLLSSSGSFTLSNAVSISGYDFTPPTINASVGKNTVDAFTITFDESPIIRNSCVAGRVRLVNYDGGEVVTQTPIEIKLMPPQGTGVFYSNGCGSTPIDTILIPSNASSKVFYAQFYETSAGLNLEANGSTLRLLNTPVGSVSQLPITIQEDTSPWYLRLHPPSFNRAEIVGTHEFNDDAGNPYTYKKIPFEIGSGGTGVSVSLKCFDGSIWDTCNSTSVEQVNGQYFYKWMASDAVNNFSRQLKVEYTSSNGGGTGDRWVEISTSHLYGPNFKVINCSGTAGAGQGQTIESMVNTSHSTLCLPSNTTYTRSGGDLIKTALVGGTIKNIIGHSSMTSVIDGSGLSYALIALESTLNSSVTIANLKLSGLTATGVKGISSSSPVATSPITFNFENIVIGEGGGISGAGSYGIYLNALYDPDIQTNISRVKIVVSDATSPSVTGIYLYDSSYIQLEDIHVSTGSNASTGIAVLTSTLSPGYISINRALIEGAGSGINISAGASRSISHLDLTNSVVNLFNKPNNNSTASNYALILSGNINNSSIESNKFRAEIGVNNQHLVGLYAPNNGEAPVLQRFSHNTFIQGYSAAPAFYGDNSLQSSMSITIQNFRGNSMAYINSAFAGDSAIKGSASGTMSVFLYNLGTGFIDSQQNRICSAHSSYNWTNKNSGLVSSDLFALLILRNNDVDALTGRCKTP